MPPPIVCNLRSLHNAIRMETDHIDAYESSGSQPNFAGTGPISGNDATRRGKDDSIQDAPENDVEAAGQREGNPKFHQLGWKRLTILAMVEAIALGSLGLPRAFATLGMLAGVFLSVGILLISLTLAPAPLGAGVLGQLVALILAGGSFLGLLAAAYAYRNSGDEMMRQANYEAANLTLILTFLLFGGWAVLSQLQVAEMFGPLPFLSGMFAIHLLSVFVVVGRRGMLKPR